MMNAEFIIHHSSFIIGFRIPLDALNREIVGRREESRGRGRF